MEPELVADEPCVTGEGPLWHPGEQALYWTDIPRGRLFRYTPATGRYEHVYQGESVGGFTIQADGALLLFMAGGKVRLCRDGTLSSIIDDVPGDAATRFNDVIADPEGRVFCGTMALPNRPGRLYRIDIDGSVHTVVEDVEVSNGLGFTPDLAGMYYTDTPTLEISLFAYDRATGALANRRAFTRTPRGEGFPDGMTVDAEGYVWSARWDGGCLVRYAPDGAEVSRISFPAKKVSCPTFGGAHYADLYVTTAGGDQRRTEGPAAGALFRLRPGVRGVPEFRSRIGL